MRDKKKTVINSIIFISLIFITYYIIFREQDLYELYQDIIKLNPIYLTVAALLMLLFFSFEAFIVKSTLNKLNDKLTFKKALGYTFICFLFSSITPGAAGGQPMEIYYLTKEKIKVSHSTIAILTHLLGAKVSGLLLGIIGYIIKPSILDHGLIYFFIIGSLFNAIPLTISIVCIFYPKAALKIVNGIVKLLKKLKIKNIENIASKINAELEVYQEGSDIMKTQKKQFIKVFIISNIQMVVSFIVPFFVYKSFGLSGISVWEFIIIQAVLHSTVCSVPLPGAVGITETAFMLIYGLVYPSKLLQSALLANRFISFYLFVLISLIVYIIIKLRLDKKSKKSIS